MPHEENISSSEWVVYLAGGGWCYDLESCQGRFDGSLFPRQPCDSSNESVPCWMSSKVGASHGAILVVIHRDEWWWMVMNGDEWWWKGISILFTSGNLLHSYGIDGPLMIDDALMNDGDCIMVMWNYHGIFKEQKRVVFFCGYHGWVSLFALPATNAVFFFGVPAKQMTWAVVKSLGPHHVWKPWISHGDCNGRTVEPGRKQMVFQFLESCWTVV